MNIIPSNYLERLPTKRVSQVIKDLQTLYDRFGDLPVYTINEEADNVEDANVPINCIYDDGIILPPGCICITCRSDEEIQRLKKEYIELQHKEIERQKKIASSRFMNTSTSRSEVTNYD